MIQKRRETPRNETEIPGEYLSDVLCHPLNERDVVVLKSDLKWGDTSRSKDYVPNEGNGSKRRWSSDLIRAGLILGLRPANERRRYKITPSLIGWSQT